LRQAVGQIATQAIRRADVETPVYGSHVLRSSAATEMLRHGVPLLAIGSVLRHASVETTRGYAKVDFQLLQQVVRPWPDAAMAEKERKPQVLQALGVDMAEKCV
jgi:site-specific recombinase XerD